MASLKKFRSELELLAEKFSLSVESDIPLPYLEHLVHKYRARGIREQYMRNHEIESGWLQDFGLTTVTQVNSADDPMVSSTSMTFGKVRLPRVVALPEEKGIYSIMGTSKQGQYYPISRQKLMLIEGGYRAKFNYYFVISDTAYLTPCTTECAMTLILDNPMDGWIFQTEIIGQDQLVIGSSYTVYDTQIMHNSVAYNPGQSFTAAAATYSGNGYVKFTNQKRRITEDDEYPMSLTLAWFITKMIFAEEFRVADQRIADVVNDSRDAMNILYAAKEATESGPGSQRN